LHYESPGHKSWVRVASEEIRARRRRRYELISDSRLGNDLPQEDSLGGAGVRVKGEVMRHRILVIEVDGNLCAGGYGNGVFIKREAFCG
jgi:hypothetical protein